MIEGIIGKKVGMTQIFDEAGNVIPATVILVEPCMVVQKKTVETDGYSSVQIGLMDERASKKVNKPMEGHFNKHEVPPTRMLREFRFKNIEEVKSGDQYFVDMFKTGDKVNVIGTSKGKGFAGVVKRWGFHGGRKTHGSMFHRHAGSTGCSAYPARVVKGKKMPGQMGNARVAVKNLTVIEADKEKNLLVVKGAVPGARGGYLLINRSDFKNISVSQAKKE